MKVFVRPNAYEAGRANIAIYNWDLDPTVSVDLSSVLSTGSAYSLTNAQNPFAAPVVSGIYDGGSISVPMTGLAPATPIGVPAPPATGPEFQAFILTSTPGPYEFFDVPQSHLFHDVIHALAANGITSGCGGGNYCPNAAVTRAQMAVFLLKSAHGAAYVPQAASGNVFDDVPAGAFAAAWIEQLAEEGIAAGCGAGDYCPNAAITRAQMAVFLLKSLLGSAYAPPPAPRGPSSATFPRTPSPRHGSRSSRIAGSRPGAGAGNTVRPIPRHEPRWPPFWSALSVFSSP